MPSSSCCRVGAGVGDLTLLHVLDQSVVAAFPSTQAPARPSLTIEDFCRYDLVAPLEGTPTRDLWDAWFARSQVAPRIVAEFEDLEWALELVRGGVGCTLTSEARAARSRSDGLEVRTIDPPMTVRVGLISRRTRLSPAAKAFAGLINDDGRHQHGGSRMADTSSSSTTSPTTTEPPTELGR